MLRKNNRLNKEVILDVAHISIDDLEDVLLELENTDINAVQIICSQIVDASLTEANPIAQAISEKLKNHPGLEALTISFIYFLEKPFIGEKAIIDCLHCLTGSAPIKHLTIKGYFNSSEFIDAVGKLLLNKNSLETFHLESIHRQRADTSVSYQEEALASLADGIANQPKLKTLILKDSNFGNICVNKLAAVLPATHLQILKLPVCNITALGADAIYQLLIRSTYLSELDISLNELTNGIEKIALALPFLIRLKNLNLTATGLDFISLKALVDIWLKYQLKIKTLSISLNPIGNMDSIIHIMSLIYNNKNLQCLIMDYCRFGDEEILKMVKLLENPKHCYLELFSIYDCKHLKDDTRQQLLNVLRKNEFICELDINLRSDLHNQLTNINRYKKNMRHRAILQTFVEKVIEFCQAYHSIETPLASLPYEIILMILIEFGKDTLELDVKDITDCSNLIFSNFQFRRQLIINGAYTPITKKDIESEKEKENTQDVKLPWWSKTIDNGGDTKTIFRHFTVFKLPEEKRLSQKKSEKELVMRKQHDKNHRCLIM